MRSTRDNLKQHAAPPLAQWLIHVAKRRSSVTYGEAARRLEIEFEFDTIFPTRMGIPAGCADVSDSRSPTGLSPAEHFSRAPRRWHAGRGCRPVHGRLSRPAQAREAQIPR